MAEGLPGVWGTREQMKNYCREPGNLNLFEGTQQQLGVEDGGG